MDKILLNLIKRMNKIEKQIQEIERRMKKAESKVDHNGVIDP